MRQQKKAKLAARTKLSFAQEEDEEEDDTEQNGSAKVCSLQAEPLIPMPLNLHSVCMEDPPQRKPP